MRSYPLIGRAQCDLVPPPDLARRAVLLEEILQRFPRGGSEVLLVSKHSDPSIFALQRHINHVVGAPSPTLSTVLSAPPQPRLPSDQRYRPATRTRGAVKPTSSLSSSSLRAGSAAREQEHVDVSQRRGGARVRDGARPPPRSIHENEHRPMESSKSPTSSFSGRRSHTRAPALTTPNDSDMPGRGRTTTRRRTQ